MTLERKTFAIEKCPFAICHVSLPECKRAAKRGLISLQDSWPFAEKNLSSLKRSVGIFQQKSSKNWQGREPLALRHTPRQFIATSAQAF